MKIAIIITCAFVIYFLIHLGLSRWSQSVITASGQTPMPQGVPSGFYYIPVTPLEMTNHHWLQVSNMILITVFYPCHLLDKTVFGGPDYAFPPITGFTDARHETPK